MQGLVTGGCKLFELRFSFIELNHVKYYRRVRWFKLRGCTIGCEWQEGPPGRLEE
jgi:hypothetical protein